jgi:hypothetical protein
MSPAQLDSVVPGQSGNAQLLPGSRLMMAPDAHWKVSEPQFKHCSVCALYCPSFPHTRSSDASEKSHDTVQMVPAKAPATHPSPSTVLSAPGVTPSHCGGSGQLGRDSALVLTPLKQRVLTAEIELYRQETEHSSPAVHTHTFIHKPLTQTRTNTHTHIAISCKHVP